MKFIILVASIVWITQSQARAESWNYSESSVGDPRQSLILERPPGEERQVSGTLTMAQLNRSSMSSSPIDIPPPEIENTKAADKTSDSWNVSEGRAYKAKYRVAKHLPKKHKKLVAQKNQKKKNSKIARVLPKKHSKLVAHAKHHKNKDVKVAHVNVHHHSGRHVASQGT